MRKSLIVSLLLLLPLAANTQETYSIAGTSGQVGDLQQYVLGLNRDVCRRYGIAPASCQASQATVCTAGNAAGGASCTAAQARAANVRIYPDTQAGREEFITFAPGWVATQFQIAKSTPTTSFIPGPAMGDYCVWWAGQNATTKNAECTKIGAPNGCVVCQ